MELVSSTAPRVPSVTVREILWDLRRPFLRVLAGYFIYLATVTLIYFPYRTDRVVAPVIRKEAVKFYQQIYAAAPSTNSDTYNETRVKSVEQQQVIPTIRAFVKAYKLENGRVLDVGSGVGYLQDEVKNYVGLDISPTAGRFYHKPYVEASATDIPFRDNEFDAAWSIWVFEHVPNPEQALREIRRVVKDGGMLFLAPAFNCRPWFADGYPVRPYRDLDFLGKMEKASLIVRDNKAFVRSYTLPIRALRQAWFSLTRTPTKFHYTLLTPNFEHYWMADSDALNSLDVHEMRLWFTSRGDECVTCGSNPILEDPDALVIRVHKH